MSDKITVARPKVGYTICTNSVINDPNLSLQAKGLYSILVSNCEEWETRKGEIFNRSKNGRDASNKAWCELVEAGWIESTPRRGEGGVFVGWDHVVNCDIYKEVPHRLTENPSVGKTVSRLSRNTENPTDGFPVRHNNTNSNNTNSNKTKEKKTATKVAIACPSFLNESDWKKYLDVRLKLGVKNTKRSLTMLVNKLSEFERERPGDGQIALINAIEAKNGEGWKSVYKPEGKRPAKQAIKNDFECVTDLEFWGGQQCGPIRSSATPITDLEYWGASPDGRIRSSATPPEVIQ